MVKQLVKAILHTVAPSYYDSLIQTRANRHGQAVMEKHGIPEITKIVVERCGMQVLSGPFTGMKYISESAGSSFLPKLIGSYERELNGVLETILSKKYETVVDVGSAEGYYAVGLAMRLSGSPKIHAFDINPEAQALCRKLAAENNVQDKVIIESFCDTERLQQTLKGTSLVVCDCEGYETEVLKPDLVPSFATTDVLVELHDLIKPGITPTLIERFSPSHDIQLIDSVERDPKDYPMISFLEPKQQESALSEFRNGPQQWAFMTPKVS